MEKAEIPSIIISIISIIISTITIIINAKAIYRMNHEKAYILKNSYPKFKGEILGIIYTSLNLKDVEQCIFEAKKEYPGEFSFYDVETKIKKHDLHAFCNDLTAHHIKESVIPDSIKARIELWL